MSFSKAYPTRFKVGVLALLFCLPAAAQQIVVYSGGNLPIGQSKQLTAYVPLAVNTVNWFVNGIPGGNSTFGTVSTTGLFQAPASIPANNAVVVQATNTADPTKFGTATLTITQPLVNLWSTRPTSVPAGSFTISLDGSNFGVNSVVSFGGVALTTTLVSSTTLKATGMATAAQIGTKVPVMVTNTGLGSTISGTVNLSVTAANPITVSVAPASASVAGNATRQFTATVAGTTTTTVTWKVNGVAGGNASTGTISTSGLFTAPAAVPSPAIVSVTATSTVSSAALGTATVAITPPVAPPVTVSVTPATVTVAPSKTQQFMAAVTGAADPSVTWSVNNIVGGNATIGTISVAGLYSAPSSAPNPAAVTIRAASVANPASKGSATVNVVGPPNPGQGLGTQNLSAGRFLEQAAFGPTPADIAHVKQVGVDAWITEQMNLPETTIADPGSQNSGLLQTQWVSRLSTAQDQLRQRVAYGLSQIFVISMNKNNYPDEVVPYLQILSRNAFGNYRQLLGDITVSSQMGMYLDLANSTKHGPGGGANENFARESMQLFTIGINKLNPDGSNALDGQGKAIPTYDQGTIQQVALAVTGWVYINNAFQDFSGPMVPNEANHDKTAKTYLGCSSPAGQTVLQDTNTYLDCIFNHPNVGPFIATRLIRSMVTSNPSPAYIQRIATVFNDNGTGVRGDMAAVVRAVLTDAEARNDATPVTGGRLKEPIYHAVAFTRALNGTISPTNGLSYLFAQMGQTPLTPPSVFSFYSPLYHIPKSPLNGPEFQIYTPTESILRGNFLWGMISNPASDFALDTSAFSAAAGNTQQLIDAVDQTLLYGRMPQGMRQSLANAIAAQSDNTSRWQAALYMGALSGFYAVQY